MSYWHEVDKDGIDFSEDKSEMHLYLYSDDNGAVYASVKVEDVKEALLKLKEEN